MPCLPYMSVWFWQPNYRVDLDYAGRAGPATEAELIKLGQ